MLKRFFSVFLVIVTLVNGSVAQAQDLDSAVKLLGGGQLELAKQQLQKITQDQPDSVPAHAALAECYLKLGDLDNAVASYRQVLKLSPQHAAARTT